MGQVTAVAAAAALKDSLGGVETALLQGTMFGPSPWVETTDLYALLEGLGAKDAAAAQARFASLLNTAVDATWLISAEAPPRRGRRRFAKPADVAAFAADPAALLGQPAPPCEQITVALPVDGRGRPDAARFFAARLEGEGVAPQRGLAAAVVARVGERPAALAMAARTLALLAWPKLAADASLAATLPRGAAVAVWALVDDAAQGKAAAALTLLDDLRRSGEDPLRVLGWAVAEWGRLARALEPGDQAALKSALGPRMAWKAPTLARRAAVLGRPRLDAGMAALAAADLTLKAGSTPPWEALTGLIYNLALGG